MAIFCTVAFLLCGAAGRLEGTDVVYLSTGEFDCKGRSRGGVAFIARLGRFLEDLRVDQIDGPIHIVDQLYSSIHSTCSLRLGGKFEGGDQVLLYHSAALQLLQRFFPPYSSADYLSNAMILPSRKKSSPSWRLIHKITSPTTCPSFSSLA